MEIDKTLSIITNILTIITSLTIIPSAFFYSRKVIMKFKKVNLSNKKRRSKRIKELLKNQSLINKITIDDIDKISRKKSYFCVADDIRRVYANKKISRIQNGLKFILSEESLESLYSFKNIINNIDTILEIFIGLILDQNEQDNMVFIDAWIELSSHRIYKFQFPIPKELFDITIIDDIKYSGKKITSLGENILFNYFIPYLLLDVSNKHKYEALLNEDIYKLLSPLWEIGQA